MSTLDVIPLTDEQLAKFLGIEDDPRWPDVIAKLPPLKRKTYERMATLELEIDLWQKGLGAPPRGVLIDMARSPRRAKKLTTKLRRRVGGRLVEKGRARS